MLCSPLVKPCASGKLLPAVGCWAAGPGLGRLCGEHRGGGVRSISEGTHWGEGANLGSSGLAPAGELELPEQPSVGLCWAGPCLPPAPLLLSLKLLPGGKETEMSFTLPFL